MVPLEGFEPPRPNGQQILSLSRLPIPPQRHETLKNKQYLINYYTLFLLILQDIFLISLIFIKN